MKIRITLIAVAALAVFGCGKATAPDLQFDPLPYAYDALEPHIDAQTMELHYSRHHKGYFDNLLKAVAGTRLSDQSLEAILAQIRKWPDAVRHNAGGHFNHTLYWTVMSPDGGGKPEGPLAKQIDATFGSFAKFQTQFTKAALSHFGSGWVWLCVTADGSLFITTTANQDNPLMDTVERRGTPILALDVWEHAYYLKYQNRRASYVDAFWRVVHWPAVSERFVGARQSS